MSSRPTPPGAGPDARPAPSPSPASATTAMAVLRLAARRWRWWHAPLGVLLGTLTLLYMGAPLQPGVQFAPLVAPWLYNVAQFGLPLVVALLLADAAVEHGARPVSAYGGAVAAVVLGGVWVIGPALMPLLGTAPGWDWASDVWLASGVGVVLSLGVTGYALWRGAARALAAAQAAEAERARRAQALESARLLALQARVEPQVLFDALGRVAATLDHDAAAADALLADTITLLRSLLPAASAAASTLGREAALVAVQARVTAEQALQPPQLRLDIAPEVEHAEFAPTLLPQLLRTLSAARPGWALQARRIDDRLAVDIAATGSGADAALRAEAALDGVDLPALHERLQAVHGPTVQVQRGPGARLHIDLPCQPHLPSEPHAPSPDR